MTILRYRNILELNKLIRVYKYFVYYLVEHNKLLNCLINYLLDKTIKLREEEWRSNMWKNYSYNYKNFFHYIKMRINNNNNNKKKQ